MTVITHTSFLHYGIIYDGKIYNTGARNFSFRLPSISRNPSRQTKKSDCFRFCFAVDLIYHYLQNQHLAWFVRIALKLPNLISNPTLLRSYIVMGLHHPLDGKTYPKYKLLLHFIQLTKNFLQREALAFNRNRCCHLALCLRLILFHYYQNLLPDTLEFTRCLISLFKISSPFPLIVFFRFSSLFIKWDGGKSTLRFSRHYRA